MRGLAGLIRLHRWKLDERRKKLADMETLAVELRAQLVRLDETLKAEAELSATSLDAARSFSAYMAAETERRSRLTATIAELERELAAARDEVAQAFRELKTYEITLENRRNQKASRERRRQQAVLDEVGRNIFRGRGSGPAA